MLQKLQFSVGSMLKLTTMLALSMAVVLWIVRANTLVLPNLLPAPAEVATVGLIFAPICFMGAVFGYFAFGVFQQPVHYASILHGLAAILSVLAMYGVTFTSNPNMKSMQSLQNAVTMMVLLLGVGIFECILRNSIRSHALAIACLSIATFCVYVFWCTASVVRSIW